MRRVLGLCVAAALSSGAPCAAKTYDAGRMIGASPIFDWQKPAPPKAVKRAAPVKPMAVPVEVALKPAVTPPRIDPASPLRQPPYPEASKRFEEQGNVTVGVLVGADGRVRRSWVEQSSGHHRLDDAAIETAREWEFIPALQGDFPVAARKTVVVRFALED